MRKWPIVLAITLFEVAAVIGAFPLIGRDYWGRGASSLWEYKDMALPSFLAIAAVVMVMATRHLPKTLRVVIPIAVVGALLLTVEIASVFA